MRRYVIAVDEHGVARLRQTLAVVDVRAEHPPELHYHCGDSNPKRLAPATRRRLLASVRKLLK